MYQGYILAKLFFLFLPWEKLQGLEIEIGPILASPGILAWL